MTKSLRVLIGVAASLAVALVGTPSARAIRPDIWASGEPIRVWTQLSLSAVANAASGDAAAARTYAMVDAAMYDAVNGLVPTSQRRTPAIVAPQSGVTGDPAVAAAAAAHDVLVALYPRESARLDAQLAAAMNDAPSAGDARHGASWGRAVASRVLANRQGDGLAGTESQPGSTNPGEFDLAWNTQPQHLAPFVIANPDAYVDHGDPAAMLASTEYADAFAIVKDVGDLQNVRPDYDATYRFWSLGGGTEQPPGAWLRVATTVSADRAVNLFDSARLFALTSMAMVDTVAPTYATKARWHFWRPVAAINRATEDPNAATEPAPYTWAPRGGKAGSPEHWSGHSTFSAAAATVLASFFGTDDIAFNLETGSSNGAVRPYTSFSEAASEAGYSRVLGGLHFPFSNTAGLDAGQAIAHEVLTHALLAA